MWPSAGTASWLYYLANIGLIIGLVVGVASTILVVWMGNVKEDYLNDALADSRERTASLERQSGQFELEIAQANTRAAEANRIAESERLARMKIEQRLADRSLTDAQLTAIADKVKPFSGQEFLVTTYWGLKEPLSITNRIYAALDSAGWKYVKHKGVKNLIGMASGVFVNVHPTADEQTKKAAASLVSALTVEGIASRIEERDDPDSPSNRIELMVGTKP